MFSGSKNKTFKIKPKPKTNSRTGKMLQSVKLFIKHHKALNSDLMIH